MKNGRWRVCHQQRVTRLADPAFLFSSWAITVQPWGFEAISSAFDKFGRAWTLYKAPTPNNNTAFVY